MKNFIKYPLIGLGILITLVVVFIILALCGVFRREHRLECGTFFLNQQTEGNDESTQRDKLESDIWIEEPDTIPGL